MTAMAMDPTVLDMTVQDTAAPAAAALDTSARAALPDVVGDAALVALLRAKPADELVPTSAWWLVAESLRTAVALRQALARGVPTAPTGDLDLDRLDELAELATESRLLADAALEELADATGVRPVPVVVVPGDGNGAHAALQRSVLGLARLLVSSRATAPARLSAALTVHQRALARCGV